MNRLLKILIIFLLIDITSLASLFETADAESTMDEDAFPVKLSEAVDAKDYAKVVELVRKSEPIIFDVVLRFADSGIEAKAKGKEASGYFAYAGIIAGTYSQEFNKKGLFDLVNQYRLYSREECKKKLRGHSFGNEGGTFYSQGNRKEAIAKWKEALNIFVIFHEHSPT